MMFIVGAGLFSVTHTLSVKMAPENKLLQDTGTNGFRFC